MRDLVRSNDPILLGYIEVLLKGEGIAVADLDRSMSSIEGSIGVLPRRLAVADGDWSKAVRCLDDAGLSEWVIKDAPR